MAKTLWCATMVDSRVRPLTLAVQRILRAAAVARPVDGIANDQLSSFQVILLVLHFLQVRFTCVLRDSLADL